MNQNSRLGNRIKKLSNQNKYKKKLNFRMKKFCLLINKFNCLHSNQKYFKILNIQL